MPAWPCPEAALGEATLPGNLKDVSACLPFAVSPEPRSSSARSSTEQMSPELDQGLCPEPVSPGSGFRSGQSGLLASDLAL